jgi:hypothetical protein
MGCYATQETLQGAARKNGGKYRSCLRHLVANFDNQNVCKIHMSPDLEYLPKNAGISKY